MFILPGLIALLVAHYTNALELSAALQSLPVMQTLLLLAGVGFLLDHRVGIARGQGWPPAWSALALWLWILVSVGLNHGRIAPAIGPTLACLLTFLLIAQGLQSFRGLRLVALSILALSLFLAGVVALQARRPFQCIPISLDGNPDAVGIADGRWCEKAADCRVQGAPGDDYVCERKGPLQTTSVAHGRVRYRGNLRNPDALALVLVLSLPFAMGLLAQRISIGAVLVLIASLALAAGVLIGTASQTALIAFVAVVAAFLLHRVTWKRLLVSAGLAVPAFLFGSRLGRVGDAFANGHLEAWGIAMDMFRSSPIWGIGRSQFVEHHSLGAYSAVMQVSAELGLIGLVLWVGVFYAGFKIVVLALRRYRGREDATLAYAWARVLLATLCGLAVGCNFVPLAYHPVAWVLLALPGAFYAAARRHDEEFRVRLGLRDLLAVTILSIVWLAGIKGYLVARGV